MKRTSAGETPEERGKRSGRLTVVQKAVTPSDLPEWGFRKRATNQ